jgi:hypothetical protein
MLKMIVAIAVQMPNFAFIAPNILMGSRFQASYHLKQNHRKRTPFAKC